MFESRWRVSRRIVFVFALGVLTAGAAVAGTIHRFIVTQTAGGGSLGSTAFLNTSSSGGALQAQVGSSNLTSLIYPFGLFGLYNSNAVGFGVVGLSTTAYGVAGQSSSTYASVFALTAGNGPALEGLAYQGGTGAGLYAEAQGTGDGADIRSDHGTYAINAQGQAGSGILGTAAAGVGVEGDSNATNGSAGVKGQSTSGPGVLGVGAARSYGVLATNGATASPMPSSSPSLYAAAYGQSANGPGVYGVNSENTGNGVGFGNNTGGRADFFAGVYGYGNDGPGVFSYSSNDIGALVTNGGTQPTLAINQNNPTTGGAPLILASAGTISSDGYVFYVNPSGDLYAAGGITSGTDQINSVSRNPASNVMTYATQQTEATVEDVGTARLVNGSAAVPLATDFRQTMNQASPYLVFVTPEGQSDGLYIASKSAAGFIVRENHSGRSTLVFDYRIVAQPYGSTHARLPLAKTRLLNYKKMQPRFLRHPSAFDGTAMDVRRTSGRERFEVPPPPPPNMFGKVR